MIESELLKEKYRVQKKLSEESLSIKDYLKRSHSAAKIIAESRGFTLRYIEMPNKKMEKDLNSATLR